MKTDQTEYYGCLIEKYTKENYRNCFREPSGLLKYPFIVPGSKYQDSLWDWDSWLTDIALREVAGNEQIGDYEKGCVLNFLDHVDEQGRMPIYITPEKTSLQQFPGKETNIHKPCLAQHALFIIEQNGMDAEWLRKWFPTIEKYIGWYDRNAFHESGLYDWLDDFAIGIDNDPCTFFRPPKSSGSIFLNCLMYRELTAISQIASVLGFPGATEKYREKADSLKEAISEHCWDDWTGFYYSVDLNLLPVDPNQWLHHRAPRHWTTLIQRIGVWSGFLAMWVGIATPEQAKRMVEEHYRNPETFFSPHGIRSLSKKEKMYAILPSCNPSCWLGPIWGIANFMTFEALCQYGYAEDAEHLAEKIITLFGQDIESCGEMHEFYDPETGKGVFNQGFQSWNLLALNMLDWYRKQSKKENAK